MRGTIPERHQLNEVILELQKMKTRFANLSRVGEISDVKYDQDKKRWYAKYKEESYDPDKPFISDWLPWKSFSHDTISVSMPPRIGMKAKLGSPGGYPEQGWIEAHHYGPDTPSPNDKPDELFIKVKKPSQNNQSGQGASGSSGAQGAQAAQGSDADETLDLHFTKDGSTVSIGSTTHKLTKDTQSIQTKTDSIDTETHVAKASKSHTVQTKDHVVQTETRTVTAQTTTIKSATYSLTGKTLINC